MAVRRLPGIAGVVALSAAGLLLATTPAKGQLGAANGEWRYWGGDGGTTHYSALAQIDRDNVKDLVVAWRWKSENFGPSSLWRKSRIRPGPGAIEPVH